MSNPKVAHPPTKAKPKPAPHVTYSREQITRLTDRLAVTADAVLGIGHVLRCDVEDVDVTRIACALELLSEPLFRVCGELDAALNQPAAAGGAR